jgi:hypothetical protein
VSEIADKAGVPTHQVYKWIKGLGVRRPLAVVQFHGRHHIDDAEWRAFRAVAAGTGRPRAPAGGR